MKKNRMMRAASALLVAVLMTTCTISGTFAKYTTSATGSDAARVANWGFESDGVLALEDLFTDNYTDAIGNIVMSDMHKYPVLGAVNPYFTDV